MSQTDSDSPCDLSRLCELLEHEYRRVALVTLAKQGRPVRLETLAERIAEDPEETRTVTAMLHHVHLPKLEAAGVVRYYPADRTAELLEDFSP